MGFVFTCSVDDGHPSDQRLAALLARHGLEATFYFPIDNIEGAPVMPAAQMRDIGRHFEVGSHTLDHCFLSRLSDRNAAFQIVRGKRVLEDILGYAVPGFCYPGGAYRQRHVALVREAGFDYARTTGNLFLGPGRGRYELATTCQFYPHGRGVYLRNFARGGQWRTRWPGLGLALRHADWERRLYLLFDAAQRREGVFHLWLHALDVDRLDAWPALAAFFSYVATRTPPAARLTNGALAARFFPSTDR
nr:polysaccharide deacetylase family protein [uncultured Duganella sp.]